MMSHQQEFKTINKFLILTIVCKIPYSWLIIAHLGVRNHETNVAF